MAVPPLLLHAPLLPLPHCTLLRPTLITHSAHSHLPPPSQVVQRKIREIAAKSKRARPEYDPYAAAEEEGPSKGGSIVGEKAAAVARQQLLEQAELEASMLGDLGRLANYMIMEALASLVLEAAKELGEELTKPRKGHGLLETHMTYSETGIGFSPTAQGLATTARASSQAALAHIIAPPSHLLNTSFSQSTRSSTTSSKRSPSSTSST